MGDSLRSKTELLSYWDDDDPSSVIPYKKSKSVTKSERLFFDHSTPYEPNFFEHPLDASRHQNVVSFTTR